MLVVLREGAVLLYMQTRFLVDSAAEIVLAGVAVVVVVGEVIQVVGFGFCRKSSLLFCVCCFSWW